MRTSILFIFALIIITTTSKAKATDEKLNQFWQISDYNVVNKLIPDIYRVTYYGEIRALYPKKTISELLEKIENIRNDYKLQDQLYLKFLKMYGNSQYLRTAMAEICGTYTLGNYVSNYIVKQYSKDKRYLQAINQRKRVLNEQQITVDKNTNEEIKELTKTDTTQDKIYTKIETEAYFPGGEDAWKNYLRKKIPTLDTILIKIVVAFTVTKEGVIDSIKIEKPTNTYIDQIIIAIFQNSPKWIPAEQNGRQVMSHRRQPISLGNND